VQTDYAGVSFDFGLGWRAVDVSKNIRGRALLVLEPTAERMVPESADMLTFWEHIYRYAFASRLVAGKRVLDIACGEGYGAAALKRAGAAQVIGVDISESVCAHARQRYGIDARPGSAEKIPLSDNSVDVIVSFETIEHVPSPGVFLDECVRVLIPGGKLVVSTPDKEVYTDRLGTRNPYHCSEMTEAEFASVLCSRFHDTHFYTQRPDSAGRWSFRTLVCENSPWASIPGFRRLRRAIQSRIFPEAVRDPTDEQRACAIDIILKAATDRRRFLNPYAVRPRWENGGEKSAYIVAIAIR
jgi:2-polyprenyl-3-methyl-5-hydroxy-6-metoxy-1,4-benzoquinol methylase